MSKNKKYYYSRLRYFLSKFGNNAFSIDESILFCKLCKCKVNSDKKLNASQNIKIDKYIKAIKLKQNKIEKKQRLLTRVQRKSTFNLDLCKTLISANKPSYKLSNEKL